MATWMKAYKFEILTIILACIVINIVIYLKGHGLSILFLDTDDYMRLIRIQDFFVNKDLADHVIARCNYPFGCDLHWTRFYDFFIILPTYIVNLFLKNINQSIEYVGFFISPVVKLVTAILLLKVFQRIMTTYNSWLASILYCVNPFLMSIGSFGRPDHHAFIVLFLMIYMCILFASIDESLASRKQTIFAAITASLCIWISPETLIVLIITDTILFVYAFFKNYELTYLIKKNSLVFLFLSAIVFIFAPFSVSNAVAFVWSVIMTAVSVRQNGTNIFVILLQLITVIGFSIFFVAEYDKISAVHVSLYLVSVVFFTMNNLKNRFSLCCITALIIGVIYLYCYPDFLKGMSANVTDYVRHIWLNQVAEMQSPLKGDVKWPFVVYAVISYAAIIIKIMEIKSKKDVSSIKWWMLIALSACYTLLAGFAYRMWTYSALFGLPIIVSICMEDRIVKMHKYVKICLAFFFTGEFLVCMGATVNETRSKRHSYAEKELFLELDKISNAPVVIMAHSNEGPQILYYTKHNAVGAPYHRQQQGIISSHEVILAPYNREVVKAHLLTTKSDYIFLRKEHADARKKNLCQLINENNIPEGLTVVPFSKKFQNIILLKVDRNRL